MTDREKLKALFDGFGIGYAEEQLEEKVVGAKDAISLSCDNSVYPTGMKKVSGYDGFYADFFFNSNGKFIEVKIWE